MITPASLVPRLRRSFHFDPPPTAAAVGSRLAVGATRLGFDQLFTNVLTLTQPSREEAEGLVADNSGKISFMQAEHSWFLGNPGEAVPSVATGDIKSVWNVYQDVESRYPGQLVGIARGVMDEACSATADMRAVGYRCAMLRLLARLPEDPLAPWKKNGQLDDAVFTVIASIPMTWIPVGTPQSGLPFDIDSFFRELRSESA